MRRNSRYPKPNKMKKIIILLSVVSLFSCSNNPKETNKIKNESNKHELIRKEDNNAKKFEIIFDESKVSKFTTENVESSSYKALVKNLSEYSTSELSNLPLVKRQVITIIVPSEISKEYLENTLKYIVAKRSKDDNDIDEIVIFVYDDNNDIGKIQYTYGKLVWAPNGKLGNVTPEIAENNIRDNYQFVIDIRDRVGKFKESDSPTKRELAIYNMIMDDKYADLSDEQLDKLVMKKFNIKSKKELDEIFYKVANYKK